MDKPDPYPYGMRLRLDDDTLKKLGIKSMPKVGDQVMFECKAMVA